MSANRCGDQFVRVGVAGSRIACCACGWTFTVRNMNALARAAKVKAAFAKHGKGREQTEEKEPA